MNDALVTLLEIQDLRSKLDEFESRPEIEEQEFNVDIGAARERLREKIETLSDGLDDRVRRRYRQIASSVDRVVVPVINGICYGCFVSIATARAADQDPNAELKSCETCGRFLYIVP